MLCLLKIGNPKPLIEQVNIKTSKVISIMPLIFLTIALIIISTWKINTKAGQPGWVVLIPIYSSLIYLKIARAPWWWLLLMCIPYVGIIWVIWALNRIVKGFGKSGGFTVGCVFLPFIFFPMLAFGDSTYDTNRLNPVE